MGLLETQHRGGGGVGAFATNVLSAGSFIGPVSTGVGVKRVKKNAISQSSAQFR